MHSQRSLKILTVFLLIFITALTLFPNLVYSNVDDHFIIVVDNQAAKSSANYQVLLVGIEEYPQPYSSLMYTIDAMEVIKQELLDDNTYADGTTMYNDQAHPKQF